jgi:hypothetical protein
VAVKVTVAAPVNEEFQLARPCVLMVFPLPEIVHVVLLA